MMKAFQHKSDVSPAPGFGKYVCFLALLVHLTSAQDRECAKPDALTIALSEGLISIRGLRK